MENNILVLSKCAYIMHWSNDTFCYGSKQYRDRKRAIYNALRSLYDASPEKRTFDYYLDENSSPVIFIDDLQVVCNPAMIERASGAYSYCDIINNRKYPYDKLLTLSEKDWYIHSKEWATSEVFSTLWISIAGEGLQYIQLDWKRDRFRFIFSFGMLYELACDGSYKETSVNQIITALGVKSKKAKKTITELFQKLF